MKIQHFVGVAIFVGILCSFATFFIMNEIHQSDRTEAVRSALLKQSHKNNEEVESDVFKLRACIANASGKDQETSCFRKYYAGVLPEPTIEQLNQLPELY
jgi:hypothetical protein